MGENTEYIIQKNINLISRNTPLCLVIGAAGFLGSHLVEELLKKNLQVLGVDNFSTGLRENLHEAVKNKNFHLVEQNAQNLEGTFPRVDYIFVVSEGGWNIDSILKLAKEHNSKIVFVSTINLYDREQERDYTWLKVNEIKLARFAKEHKLNARVLRLAAVYGPRMHFRYKDGALRLIHAAVAGKLQGELSALEFSSRALYIDDAVKLIIKSMFSGATAWKIYDGALLNPVKLSEIRELLLDPLWYETRGFSPTELPPWLTPNLAKTAKELSWKPQASVLHSFKHTLNYFKEHELKEAEPEKVELKIELPQFLTGGPKLKYKSWEKAEDGKDESGKSQDRKDKREESNKKRKFISKTTFFVMVGWLIIMMGIFYPIFKIGWGVYNFKQNLTEATDNLSKGEVEKSLSNIAQAREGVRETQELVNSLVILERAGFVSNYYRQAEDLVEVLEEIVSSSEHAIKGSAALLTGMKVMTGESNEDIAKLLETAELELGSADNGLSKAAVKFEFITSEANLPKYLDKKAEEVNEKIGFYSDLVKKSRAAATLLPKIVGVEGKKSYLLLLQNNSELRPTGGFIGTVARVDFEQGKMKALDVKDVYEVDGQLKIRVEPPVEIRDDLGQKDWFLRDSNFDPDFPTSARQAAWFYTKETGMKVDGVIALDVSAMEDLLSVVGALNLTDYNEQVTSGNLFERAVTHSEQGFFPGSQAKTNFLTGLSRELLGKMFFVPHQNWAGIVGSISKSLTQKHILLYIDDQKLFSYLVSNNWSGTLPRPAQEVNEGEVQDILSVVEANLGANKVNYYLDRNYNLETSIGKDGDINHKLRISYTNRSPNAWPGGTYKNRLRIYLPNATKIIKASWGESDVLNKMTSFVEYGRSGYSVLLELASKEQKRLILEYQLAEGIKFKGNRAVYKLDIIKQAGTLTDPLEWKIGYPINYKMVSPEGGTGQEFSISTDLSTDKHFEIEFQK